MIFFIRAEFWIKKFRMWAIKTSGFSAEKKYEAMNIYFKEEIAAIEKESGIPLFEEEL